jgi:hypothetical protein
MESGIVTAVQLHSVHCLRFLRDAFRTRPDCLAFLPSLAQHISERIRPKDDLLAAKLALEATGLLPEALAEPILIKALKTDNAWLGETTLHACRHLKRIGPELERRLSIYLSGIGVQDFLRRYREIAFSLSLSDAFRSLRHYCMLRSIDNRIFVAGLLCCAILQPTTAAMLTVLYVFDLILNMSRDPKTRSSNWFLRLQAGIFIWVVAPVSTSWRAV